MTHSPGWVRLLGVLLDFADKQSGAFPKTKRLAGFPQEEQLQVQMALQRHHWGKRSGGMVVLVHRYIEDEWGSPERFRQEASRQLGRPLLDVAGARATAKARLLASLEAHALPDNVQQHVRRLIERGTGWVGKSMVDGVEATERRFAKTANLLASLPRTNMEPLRQVCATTLGSSHALDDDPLLASAVEGALAILSPDVLDRDALWARFNVLARVPDESVRLHGHLELVLPTGSKWSTGVLEDNGCAAALLEDTLQKAALGTPPLLVLSVENPATWHALKGRLAKNSLCVLTDGMPNQPTQRLLQVAGASAPWLHWGDIDTGGLRVLHYLQSLGPARAVLMDGETLGRYRDLLVRDDKPLDQTNPVLAEAWRLGGWLEQERIPLDEAVAVIAATATTRTVAN